MSKTIRVAVAQMQSGADPGENLSQALELIDRAATQGAEIVALPEVWNYLGAGEGTRAAASPIPGPITEALAERAQTYGIYLHGGSIYEVIETDPLVRNTTVVFGPDGQEIARYSKIHMFDVSFEGQFSFRESDNVRPGAEIVTAELAGIPAGFAICYDLRFPELFRVMALRGAQLVFLPAAFTLHTGRDHWEVLIRARAIENQCFMLAPAQYGRHPGGAVSFGRAMIVDPWGLVLAQAPDGIGLAFADLDFSTLERVRRQVPSLLNRRPATYVWPREEAVVR